MSRFSDPLRKKIESYLDRYETRRSSILPVLHAIHDECGYVSEEQIEELHEKFGLDRIHVKEVVTFYDIYKDSPQRKFIVRFCKSLTCAMLGAQESIARVREHINRLEAELGEDCPFSLEEFPCLGKCDGAPVTLVNKERHEHVTVAKVDELLQKYAPLAKG